MADIADIEKDLSTAFAEETQEYKEALIAQWTLECVNWLNKARKYIELQETEEKYLIQLGKTANKSFENFSLLLKRKRQAKKLITNKAVLQEGYILLNKIGEKIRGEEILYSVTVSQTGKGIASGSAGGVYTVQVNLQTFLKEYVTFSHTRIILKSSTSLYKMIESQIKNNQIDEYEKWTEEKIVNFSLYDNQIRNAKNQDFSQINAGNMLEGFLRFLDRGYEIFESSESNYWGPLIESMKDTLKNPDPFWKGPDLADKQIKGLNASITNLSSLMSMIEETFNVLRSTKIGADTIKNLVVKKQIQNVNNDINKTIEEVVDKLIEMYTSDIAR